MLKTAVSSPTISWDADKHGRTRTNGRFLPHIPQSRGRPVCLPLVTPKTAVFSQLSYGTQTNTDERGQTAVFLPPTSPHKKRPFSPHSSPTQTAVSSRQQTADDRQRDGWENGRFSPTFSIGRGRTRTNADKNLGLFVAFVVGKRPFPTTDDRRLTTGGMENGLSSKPLSLDVLFH